MERQVTEKGGIFLEAPVSGSKGPAAAGALIFLAGGDPALYDAVVTDELELMGKASFHFGPVGSGTKMKLVVTQPPIVDVGAGRWGLLPLLLSLLSSS